MSARLVPNPHSTSVRGREGSEIGTARGPSDHAGNVDGVEPAADDTGQGGHGAHGLMMIACCIPMLAIAGLLVITGVASPRLIIAVLICTALMASMMFMAPRGHR